MQTDIKQYIVELDRQYKSVLLWLNETFPLPSVFPIQ